MNSLWEKTFKSRIGTGIGWILLTSGALVLYGYGIYAFLTDSSESVWVRLGLAGIGLGMLTLFLYVLRQRLVAIKSDRYKDVEV